MNKDAAFQRLPALTSILAVLLALGSIGLQVMILGITTDPFSNPTLILETGSRGASIFRWGMILDMFGYYLLLLPLALLLWNRLRAKDMNLATLCTCCGLAYILIGAIG